MNAHPKWLKAGAEAKALVEKELHALTGKPSPAQVEAEKDLDMPLWRWHCTMLEAKHVFNTGAANLGPSPLAEAGINMPYVKGWMAILREIEWNKRGFIAAFLRDVIFWSGRSTSGRYNPALGRFERWGVKSVEGWRDHCEFSVCRRDFFRVKNRLVGMGLIEAASHFQFSKYVLAGPLPDKPVDVGFHTALWVKPTEELSRAMFEPGHWEQVREKYAHKPTKKKPRGIHAKAKSEAIAINCVADKGGVEVAPKIPKNGTSLPLLSGKV